MKSGPFRTSSHLAILVAFCVTVAACGGADAVAEPEAIGSVETPWAEDGDAPEFGASLDEFLAATTDPNDGDTSNSGPPNSGEFERLEWEDLVPPGFSGDDIRAQFADQLAAVEAGSPEAEELYIEMQNAYDPDAINLEYDGEKIQLAGFVAPLSYTDELVTEFLLVPFFGACIHVPPPPSNQTVMVTLDEADGLTIEDSWGAVWVTGTLAATATTTDIGSAGYSITGANSGVHDDY